jgi:hypothetical protein
MVNKLLEKTVRLLKTEEARKNSVSNTNARR